MNLDVFVESANGPVKDQPKLGRGDACHRLGVANRAPQGINVGSEISLLERKRGSHRYRSGADQHRAEERAHEVHRRWQNQDHAVVGTNPRGAQPGGHAASLLEKLAIGHRRRIALLTFEGDGQTIRLFRHSRHQDVGQCGEPLKGWYVVVVEGSRPFMSGS